MNLVFFRLMLDLSLKVSSLKCRGGVYSLKFKIDDIWHKNVCCISVHFIIAYFGLES